jgi:adenylyltransferase/sulfurtransferase
MSNSFVINSLIVTSSPLIKRNFVIPFSITMKSICVQELNELKSSSTSFQLIDVRGLDESLICSLGGILIPMNEIPTRISEIPKDIQVIVYCRAGMRSASVIQYLEHASSFDNLYNLEGGILDWIREIDPSMTAY